MYYLEKENNPFRSRFRKIVLTRRRLYYICLQNDCFRQQSPINRELRFFLLKNPRKNGNHFLFEAISKVPGEEDFRFYSTDLERAGPNT